MNKFPAPFLIAGLVLCSPLRAQDSNSEKFKQIDAMDGQKTPSPSPGPSAKPAVNPAQEPTTITAAKESTFDGKSKVAVLFGDVKVENPEFRLSADKLTIYFHKNDAAPKKDPGASGTPAKKSPSPTPAPTPKPAASPGAPNDEGGIDKVIAEGNVLIQSDRPDAEGGPPVHYAGKGAKVEYNPATGEMVLYGMPELQKGMDTLVATDESTWISLNRDGTMVAHGPHKINIKPPPPDQAPTPKPTEPEVKLPGFR